MKKAILIISALTSILLSCNNHDKETNTISAENKTVIAPTDDDHKNSISDLETKYKKEIGGLWKLYKKVYSDGSSSIEKENSFIEIKSDNKFSDKYGTRFWFLSFSRDSTSTKAFLFTQAHPDYDNIINVSRIEKTVDNGVTYLKLTSLKDGDQKVYIRQQ